MPTRLAEAADRLAVAVARMAGATVVYRRGRASASVAAILGRSFLQTVDEAGLPVETLTRDFIVRRAALVVGGETVEPRPGDRIVETQDDRTLTHVVTAVGDQPCWREMDPEGTLLRIHTLTVKEAAT